MIGNTDQPGGREPTVVGARMQILSLVFLAGNLELLDSAPAVLSVAKRAVKQYEIFALTQDYHLNFRFRIVKMASPYNRQALTVGLIGTMSNREDPIVSKYQARFQTKELTHFDARTTPYDAAAQLNIVDIDYPQEPLKQRYLTEVSDADLEEILAAASKK